MARNEHPNSVPERLLAALDAEPSLIEYYDLAEVETLPISVIRNRLVGLGLPATIPANLQQAIVELSTPANPLAHLIKPSFAHSIKPGKLFPLVGAIAATLLFLMAGQGELAKGELAKDELTLRGLRVLAAQKDDNARFTLGLQYTNWPVWRLNVVN